MEEISCKELLDGNEALILNHSGLLSKGATLVLLFNTHLHDILCRLPIVFCLEDVASSGQISCSSCPKS